MAPWSSCKLSIIKLSILIVLFCGRCLAAEGGYSNYVPGTYGDFGMALAPSETWTLRNDIYYYEASDDRSVRSGRLELDLDLSIVANYLTVLYQPGIELWGAKLVSGIFVPVVHLDIETTLSTGLNSVDVSEQATGLGDLALIPLALYWNQGHFHSSFVQLIVMPTGDYDTDNAINDGLNYWSFDSNVAVSYLNPENGIEYAFNLGYIYNTENSDTDYQTGQEVHLDVAVNQYFSESFAVGMHGFYLKQITGDSGDGALLGSFQAESAGIGPALLWARSVGNQEVSFVFKWLYEFDAENRMEGDHVMLSFALDW